MSRRIRKPLGCLFVLILLVVLVLVLVQILGPGIATKVANQKLPEQLGTSASLGALRLNLLGGTAGVYDLQIDQPEGFEGEPLLSLGSFEADVPLGSALSREPLIIKRVHLDGLDLRMITDTNKVTNVSLLGPPTSEEVVSGEDLPVEDASAEEVTAETPPEEDPEETPEVIPEETPSEEEAPTVAETAEETEATAPPPPIWVQHLLLENISVAIQDLGNQLQLDLTSIELEINNLRIQSGDTAFDPADIRAQVSFISPRGAGQLLIRGRIGTLDPSRSDRIPPMQLAIGLIGFDLNLIDPLLKPSPAAAKSAISGGGFDLEIFMQVTPGETLADQQLQGTYVLMTDRGGKMKDNLGGTLYKPDFPPARILGNLVGFQFARIGRFGVNIAQGGLEAGKTVLMTGGAAVKGVGNTALKLGGGVLKTVKGVVTLDMKEAGSGLKDATVGTVGAAVSTVGDTAGTAIKGVGDTAGKVAGSDDHTVWWEQVETRKQAFRERTEAWLEEQPFPPKPVERKGADNEDGQADEKDDDDFGTSD